MNRSEISLHRPSAAADREVPHQHTLAGFLQSVDVLAANHAAHVYDINESLASLAAEYQDLLDSATQQAVADFAHANQVMRNQFHALVECTQLCDLRIESDGVPRVQSVTAASVPEVPPVYDRVEAFLVNRDPTAASDPAVNRRASPRRPYPFLQHIAEYVPGQVLDSRQFCEVRCHDLSASGFSYWAAEIPSQSTLIVRFGSAPDLSYLTARIMHVTERNRGPQRRYLIGCKFLERVSISPTVDQEPPSASGATS